MSTTAISVRLDSDIKEQFDKLCKEFGISTNAAFNIFARAVVRECAQRCAETVITREP